ncbi:MAG: hypothetical protein PHD67_07630 [Oscillospiraceae bacterium]|nr:hypothetical protein [Oscillospiraceae bacterium]
MREEIRVPAGPFRAVVAIRSQEAFEAAADLVRDAEGKYTFFFTRPESLAGMEMSLENGAVDMRYLGLSSGFREDALPDGAPIKAIASALTEAAGEPLIEGSSPELSLSNGADSLRLELDPDTGFPLKISFASFEVEFQSFSADLAVPPS